MDDLLKEFLMESSENLDQLDQDFVNLEQDPTNRELLSRIFRCVHTIKGTCGFLGFSKLESVTHVGENLLGQLRDGKQILNSEIANGLLALVDAIRNILSNLEKTGEEGNGDYSELVKTLKRLHEQGENPATAAKGNEVKAEAVPAAAEEAPHTPTEVIAAVQENPASQSSAESVPAAKPVTAKPAAASENPNSAHVSESAIRVEVGVLDRLMNLVGELVLSRNQIVQYSSSLADANLNAASQRLNIITSELQEGIMKTRMQPIGGVWNKFPRVVRDLSKSCGKKVRLEMQGQETELDKSLIEAIKDPLTHIVRNSVDHGIEMPEKRRASGKDEEGVLLLKASHEGGQVIIEIIDDGGGIDPVKLKDKAVSKGLFTPEQAAKMSDAEALNLIFMAGFSTAEKVTNISGRGVGMDVVRTNIERINGAIDIQSKPGVGTTLKIKIPLTLAIIPALIVNGGGSRFAIPQANLVELVGLDPEKQSTAIEYFQGAPVYRLRGKLLPLVYLNKILETTSTRGVNASMNIVVLQADGQPFGLVVDDVHDTQEIVVKPLGKQLKKVSIYAGATIMGDGKLALILDIMSLARTTHIAGKAKGHQVGDERSHANIKADGTASFLLLRGVDDGRMAIPLSNISRLEEFKRDQIEFAGSQEVVQYRDSIMPLIRISSILEERRSVARYNDAEQSEKTTVHAVVFNHGKVNLGILVEEILDIFEAEQNYHNQGCRHGVLGTMVVQGRVTEVLDITQLVQMALPDINLKLDEAKPEANFEIFDDVPGIH